MRCRILDLPTNSALHNTALDGFLLQEAAKGVFTLAFTQWRPSVLIANSQSLVLDVDEGACEREGVEITRRLSGGKSVYVSGNHLVFSLAGPRFCFSSDLNELRRQVCKANIKALQKLGVPADFFRPDHIVISAPSIRTLGSSGQVIKKDAVALGMTIRYQLTDDDLQKMLAVLKINGQSLTGFFDQVKRVLASIREFVDVSREEVKAALTEEIVRAYGCNSFYHDNLDYEENQRIAELTRGLIADGRLKDQPTYQSRGICDLYLDGQCIVPEIAGFLPYSRPSSAADSTII